MVKFPVSHGVPQIPAGHIVSRGNTVHFWKFLWLPWDMVVSQVYSQKFSDMGDYHRSRIFCFLCQILLASAFYAYIFLHECGRKQNLTFRKQKILDPILTQQSMGENEVVNPVTFLFSLSEAHDAFVVHFFHVFILHLIKDADSI